MIARFVDFIVILHLHPSALRTGPLKNDMEQYIVSARKYRPATFGSVVGQKALTGTLKNAIATDRLAHAYLFCGSRGVGKTSCARIFAKTINCTNRTPDGEACNECDSCRQFNENRSMNILELDAASNNGVEDMRSLIDQVMVPPTTGRYRVFIIDEVHMLTSQAFNAFLKTLEEPPGYVIFILATTEKHKIIPTILSRCQIYDFNRITIADMVAHMQRVAASEGITAEPAALNVIARKADGAMRDALSIFDQVAASSRGNITYQSTVENLNVLDNSYYGRLVDAFVAQDVATSLLIYKEIRDKGFDSLFFINGLAQYLRDLMVAANPATLGLLEATDDVRQEMAEKASKLHPTYLYKAMDLCNDADMNFRTAGNKQFLIELTLIKLCQPDSLSSDESGSDEGLLRPLESFTTSSPAPQALDLKAAPASRPAPAATAPAATAAPSAAAPQKAAPYTAPAARPAAVSEPHHRSYTPGTLSMRNRPTFRQQTSADAGKPKEPVKKRDKAFTDADFEAAWHATLQSVSDEPLLAGVLALADTRRTEGTRFAVMVGTNIQADTVTRHLENLCSRLRDRLENDHIELEARVVQGEIPPQFWSEQQVLDHILKEYPAVGAMMSQFKMRLI